MPLMPAILGSNLRLGNFRLGYQPAALQSIRETRVRILLDGVLANSRVRMSGVSIHDVLNDAPNTCTLTIDGTPPPVSGMALRVSINSNTPRLLFSGTIETDDVTYEGQPTQLAYPCTAIDDTARLNKRRPFGTWTNVSATTVAQELIASFAPGFTATHVQAGLATITVAFDGSEGFSGCLRQIVKLIGGYFYVEDRDLHLFTEEATEQPEDLDGTGLLLDDPSIMASSDDSQLRTRVYGRGHGEKVTVDVGAGETIVPLTDAVMFTSSGGQAIVSTTPDGTPTQILTYTGVQSSVLAGSTVGTSPSPTVPLVPTLKPGAGLGTGLYEHGYTFVTSVGETLLSPLASITTTSIAAPTVAPTPATLNDGIGHSQAGWAAGDTLTFKISYSGDPAGSFTSDTAVGPASGSYTLVAQPLFPGTMHNVKVTFPTSADTNVKYIHGWVSHNGGAYQQMVGASNVTSPTVHVLLFAGGIGPATPPSPNPNLNQVQLAGIALGPSGTTARKVYRTVVNGSQPKLLTTLADNLTTTYTDSTADGSLGANAPTENTSALESGGTIGGDFVKGAPVVFATNGASTNATTASPIFTSATYTFVAADVGALLYIKTGTNWLNGSYAIVSVAGGAATVAGPIATVASPTGATWGVDYSDFTTARYTFTDLAIDAASNVKFTSAAFPVGPNFIGNTLSVTNAVGFTVQDVVVLSTSGTVATVDKPLGTVSSTGGRGVLGLKPSDLAVIAGSSTLPLASTGSFSTTGGWATLGPHLIRYTGIIGNTLTGIPASGVGALTDTVSLGDHVYVAPALTGVTGLTYAMLKGSAVYLWVQRDDLAAQAAAAARETTDDYTSDGIHEHLLTDDRRGEASLIARCDADLVLFAQPIVTVAYATRDMKTKSGKPIVVTLSSPPISETLTIQEVTITEIDAAPGTPPRFTASASSVRFSLEDMLRRLSGLLPD